MSSGYDVIVEVVASNIIGEPREANYAAVPRAVDTRLALGPEGGRVAPAGDARDPRLGPAGSRARHDWSQTFAFAAVLRHGRGWFRTTDLSRVKRALSH